MIETVDVLETELDDMTGEEIGYVTELLLEAGGLDVHTIPIYMKKNRPGICIKIICHSDTTEKLKEIIFRETTTLGIRMTRTIREVLDRDIKILNSSQGYVQVKQTKGEFQKSKVEFEDLKRVSREKGIPLKEMKKRLEEELQ
ncbi:nickel insertion protein [Candidatus Margulisiibacteriota bacterium]